MQDEKRKWPPQISAGKDKENMYWGKNNQEQNIGNARTICFPPGRIRRGYRK
jgi:hypothetical protein